MVIFMKLIHFVNGKKENIYDNVTNLCEENEKKYKFFLDNILNYIYITDRLIFIRENEDYIFNLEIAENPLCTINLKKENKEFDLEIKNCSYSVKDNYIDIKYEINNDGFDKHHIILEIEE